MRVRSEQHSERYARIHRRGLLRLPEAENYPPITILSSTKCVQEVVRIGTFETGYLDIRVKKARTTKRKEGEMSVRFKVVRQVSLIWIGFLTCVGLCYFGEASSISGTDVTKSDGCYKNTTIAHIDVAAVRDGVRERMIHIHTELEF